MYATAEMPFRRPMASRRPGLVVPAAICPSQPVRRDGTRCPWLPVCRSYAVWIASDCAQSRATAVSPARHACAGPRNGGESTAPLRALSLPESGPGSLLTDAAGDPLVYIQLTRIDLRVRTALSAAGARIMHANDRYGMVTALVAPRQLAAVAAVPGVVSMQEALAPMVRPPLGSSAQPAVSLAMQKASPACPAGSVISEGDTQLRAARARERFGLDGSGVTVGVLSGSYDVENATQLNAADDIAAGDLPGAGNPCGYNTPVQVLAELRVGAGRDEGRAMLQIVT